MNKKENREVSAERRAAIMKKTIAIILKITITLLLVSPIAIFAFEAFCPKSKKISKRELKKIYKEYSITSKKDSSFNKMVGRVFVISKVEAPLIPVFAHSFEHSLISAFRSNGMDASVVVVESPESDSMTDYSKEAETFAPDATMRINIKPIYRTRDDGYQAIVGTDFDVSLIDTATEKRVWHASGKVDYIRMFGPHYRAGEGIKKEFAFSTTKAIVSVFAAEVNGQEPARVLTVIEDREKHGQRVD
jgi:hypothetical protein